MLRFAMQQHRGNRHMSLEVELKLWVTAPMSETLLQSISNSWPELAEEVSAHPPVALLNAYFETAAQWFRRHDAGLRTRCRNGQYQQTIKLAGQQLGAAHVRPEYNQPCAGVVPQLADFPSEIWPADADVVALQQQLQELFRTDFIRYCWILTLADGTKVEAVLDQGNVIAKGQNQPLLEIELELISGDAQQLFLLARQLLQKLPLCLGFQSKAERGYRLAQQQPLALAPFSDEAPSSFSVLLRQIQQNLSLKQAALPSEALSQIDQALALQWQHLQQLLSHHAATQASPDPLLQDLQFRAPRLQLQQSTPMTLWLLDFSGWLLQQPTGGNTDAP